MAEDVSHTFSRASAILVRQMEIFHVSLVHPRGQLWAELWQVCRPFDGWKWPSNSKLAKFDHKDGHNPKVTCGHKFALIILSQEYSSDLILLLCFLRNNYFCTRTLSKKNYSWPNEPCWIEYSFIEKLLGNSSALQSNSS